MSISPFVQRHYRRNFLVNLWDGALFNLGIVFFSSATVLPLYVHHLTDSPVLIGLVPAIATSGWYLPQLLLARRVEALRYRLPLLMRVTMHERLPVLLLGISLLLAPNLTRAQALLVFFALYAWQAIGGGLAATSWVDLIARVIPVERRGRLLGLTNLVGSILGAGGAVLISLYLRQAPFPRGFAYVF